MTESRLLVAWPGVEVEHDDKSIALRTSWGLWKCSAS